jgi:protein-S-isoprenylcysteine O-methyltransferase Ste14
VTLERFFAIAYFAGLIAQIVIRMPYDRLRRREKVVDRRMDGSEVAILAVLSVGGLLLPALYAFTPWLAFADFPWTPQTQLVLGVLGLVLTVLGLWVFWRSHHDLGAYWSPTLEIGAEHRLITDGIYGTVRHPMYLSQLLMGLAQLLLLQNWLAGPGGLVAFALLILVRAPKEERMMEDHFGAEYAAYRARTGGVLPRMRARGG